MVVTIYTYNILAEPRGFARGTTTITGKTAA